MFKEETLSDKLKTIKDDEYVYLGCKNGSSWIFIGTCKKLKENLTQLDIQFLQAYQRAIEKCNSTIATAEKRIREESEELEAEVARVSELAETKKAVKDYLIKIKKLNTSIQNAKIRREKKQKEKERYISEMCGWEPFHGRKVEETYRHNEYPQGIAILVSGVQVGKYWDLDEVQKDENKGIQTIGHYNEYGGETIEQREE